MPCMLDPVNSVAFVFVHRQNSPLTTGTGRVPNSPTGQVLEAGQGWPVLVMAVTGPD